MLDAAKSTEMGIQALRSEKRVNLIVLREVSSSKGEPTTEYNKARKAIHRWFWRVPMALLVHPSPGGHSNYDASNSTTRLGERQTAEM